MVAAPTTQAAPTPTARGWSRASTSA